MKIGYYKKQHLPSYPVYLSGYPRNEKTIKVHLAPEISAITIMTQECKLVLCSIDTILVSNEMVHAIRKAVARQSDIPYENIHISATHTHSAPCIYKMNIPDPPVNEEWMSETIKFSIEVILKSMQHMKTCECYFQTVHIYGCYGNRNDVHGIENKEAYIITFSEQDQVIGKLINLSCHNTVNSTENVITSDLFGGIRKELENDHIFCMITNGISGDISTRHYRQGTDCKEIERMSKEIAKQLQQPNGKKIQASGMICDFVSTNAYQNIKDDPMILKQLRILEEKESSHTLEGWEAFTLESYRMRQQIGEFYHYLETSILKIDDIIFITLPGEAVTYFDTYFRQRFPQVHLIFLGTTNGYAGYLIPENDPNDFESQMAEVSVHDVWRHITRIEKHIEFIISTLCGNM